VTYSIVARDGGTGDLGVAVQSHWFAAGIVCWARSGVGAVATQATALFDHGPLGLDLLAEGRLAEEALAIRLEADEDREVRQVAVVDARGRVAVHTGSSCIPEAGHATGDGFSCQANMMWRDTVWDAMAAAFAAAEGDLAGRLLVALEAGESQGGDVRGRQAARILVVRAEPTDRPWEDVVVDLRIDDHPAPLPELRRLLDTKRAYDHLQASEEAATAGNREAADLEAAAAMRLAPDNPEIAFWNAIATGAAGELARAREMLAVPLRTDPGWAELLRRLGNRGLADVTPELAAALLDEGPPGAGGGPSSGAE
jgi:uncharacterized Ntn-hydrolase superfamily protein